MSITQVVRIEREIIYEDANYRVVSSRHSWGMTPASWSYEIKGEDSMGVERWRPLAMGEYKGLVDVLIYRHRLTNPAPESEK